MRDSFGSKIGLVLATAGSAVGLGNVWRFPFMTGQHGGAAFIIIYIFPLISTGCLSFSLTTFRNITRCSIIIPCREEILS